MNRYEMRELAESYGLAVTFDVPMPTVYKPIPGVPNVQASVGYGEIVFYAGDWTPEMWLATLLHEIGHHVKRHTESGANNYAALNCEAEAWLWAMDHPRWDDSMLDWARKSWHTYWDNPDITDGSRQTPAILHLQRRLGE